jgi:hypothetical protein
MNTLENRLLNLVAGLSPWLAPLIPTYFAAYNAYQYLAKGHNWWDAGAVVIVALVVEFIGLAGVHTAVQFWNWNRTKLKTDDAAPLALSIVAVVFYVAIIIIVNAILDYYAVADPALLPYVKIAAVALLSLLALNSALIVALRAGQSERERKASEGKKERSERRSGQSESYRKVSVDEGKVTGKFPNDWRKIRRKLTIEQVSEIAHSAHAGDIAYKFNISERTAVNWRKYAALEVQSKAGGNA